MDASILVRRVVLVQLGIWLGVAGTVKKTTLIQSGRRQIRLQSSAKAGHQNPRSHLQVLGEVDQKLLFPKGYLMKTISS
jgi:hypothetical protein